MEETISLAVVDNSYQYLRNAQDYALLMPGIERCDIFSSAREFLVALQANFTYESVILDAFLNDMRIEDFLRQFGELNLPAKPAILITQQLYDPKQKSLLKNLGADAVIRRPDSVTELMDSALSLAMNSEQYISNRLKEQIWWVIREAEIPAHDNAYNYLFMAIEYSLSKGVSCAPTKEIYPLIRKKYNVSEQAVDSGLRRLSEKYLPRDGSLYQQLAREAKLKPGENLSNTKLISTLVQRVVPRMGSYGREMLKDVD